jgi:hypothetical protein
VKVPATPIISFIDPVNIAYGTALDNGQLDGTAIWTIGGLSIPVAGTFTYTSAAGIVLGAGNGQIENVVFTPSDTTDYTTATSTVTVNVAPAVLTVTAFANNKTYGDTASDTGTVSGVVNNDGITASFSSAGDAAQAPVAGSPYLITGTLSDPNNKLGNYTVMATNNYLTVGKANATVAVAPYTVTYDGKPHTATVTITGVNTETGAAVGTVTLNSTHTNAGTYSDSWSFTGTANYNNASGTVTNSIAPAPLTVSAGNKSRTYGAANPALTYAITGFVNNEPSTVVIGTPNLSTPATASSPAGRYAITVDVHPLSAANYTFQGVNGTLTVNPATPPVSVNLVTIPYGTALANRQLSGTGSWTVGGQPVPVAGTFTYTSAAGTVLNIGNGQSEAVTFTPKDSTDYTMAASTVSINVIPAPPTVQSVQVNDGSAQRSMVTSLTVTFSQPIASLDAGAFEIHRGTTALFPTHVKIAGNQVVLHFKGLAGVVDGSLLDGRYTLIEHRGKIHGGSNETLVANHRDAFFCLFGDVNGDGKVTATDVAAFLAAFRSRKGMANYRWYLDYNGDGVIDRTDAAQFLQRYEPQLVF